MIQPIPTYRPVDNTNNMCTYARIHTHAHTNKQKATLSTLHYTVAASYSEFFTLLAVSSYILYNLAVEE